MNEIKIANFILKDWAKNEGISDCWSRLNVNAIATNYNYLLLDRIVIDYYHHGEYFVRFKGNLLFLANYYDKIYNKILFTSENEAKLHTDKFLIKMSKLLILL